MKTLVLIRHAKSDWGYDFLNDIDRPLNEKGYRDAYQLSKWYAENFPLPQIIVSSPAIRAVSTALIFARALKYKEQNISVKHGIYDSITSDFLNNIQQLSDSINTAMFFGHNPAITNLFNLLNAEIFIDNIPTCGIVKLDFEIQKWEETGKIKASKTEQKFLK